MNLKIAIVIERADIRLGSEAARSMMELAGALSSKGLDVDIIAATGQTQAGNVHILCDKAQSKRTGFYKFAELAATHLSKSKYDIIHAALPFDFADVYQPGQGSYAEAVFRNAASYQNKIIEWAKRLMSFANLERTALLHAERKLCTGKTGPAIVASCQYVADQFKHHYATACERLAVICSGIKLLAKVDTHQGDALRTRVLTGLGLTEADDPVLFLFAGNDFRLMGLAPAIKAIAADAGKPGQRKAFLVVIGNDSEREYRKLAKKFGIPERIVFLGPLRHVRSALSISDVAILPTFYDPAGRFVFEAIAAGKPVITTPFNGAADILAHGQHGHVIDSPEDIPALAQAVTLFTDTTKIEAAARAIAEDNLAARISIGRSADEMIALYESVLQRKNEK